MNIEQWLPVVGWEGVYEVSDQGRVRSLDRIIECAYESSRWNPGIAVTGTRFIKGRILKLWKQSGYHAVSLKHEGLERKAFIHDLVLEAFVGPKPKGFCVRHGKLGPLNNSIGNICYGTYSENNYDLVRDGTHHNASKTHCPHGHEYTPDNTRLYTKRGYRERQCRACAVIRGRAEKAHMKAERHARGLKKRGRKVKSWQD